MIELMIIGTFQYFLTWIGEIIEKIKKFKNKRVLNKLGKVTETANMQTKASFVE